MTGLQAEFSFSPRILEHLGIAAYNSVQKCLAELVANAYDADASHVVIELPDVLDDSSTISIADDGVGMTAAALTKKFLHVGRNRRADGERTAKQRLVIGSKGIGKLAGFGIASRVRLTTRSDGLQSAITIDKSALDNVQSLVGHKIDVVQTPSELAPGTKIELIQLHAGLKMPSADSLRRHLYRSMPMGPGFSVTVNGVECTAEEVLGDRTDFAEQVPGVGQVTGFYVLASTRQKRPGLSVRVRGRIVQAPSLFSLDTRAHGFFTAEKIVGEIRAEFLDPEDPGQDRQDLIKTSRDGFLEDSETVRAFYDWAGTFVRKVIQGADEGETKKRTDTLMSSPEVKARLEKLPPHVRGTASTVVRGIIAKLKTASEEDAKSLIEWVLRYYESSVLKELMNAIAAADVHEAEKLAALVSEWGLTQLTSVASIVQTQINIITRLEELVSSDKAYEIDLHKLVEANLWLVKEGLELWSSDKPLRVVLDGKIDQLYADKSDLRPDLICRSRDEGHQATIIEFKRPKEKIRMEHVTQALGYEGLLKAHRPNLNFTTYVVGREYDSEVLAIREKQANAGLHLWSFGEILQRARARFERILDILGR
ncbi:ATP-binding protein [Gemmatimonas groenlandica]|uniref:ATP-binding protein n=1 Tax=Gemmatimonas groenlandica TaxID=2732249 RepID=A0A6M4ITG8_9BACT|nr:ATP-binding protein [Gemmatimonas groenlandica]QJR36776.1 hypothetical protein HKW67_15255 [Gemmatimonas groenlandica]